MPDDPLTDGNNEPNFFGQRYKRAWGNKAALGVAPTQKSLEPDNLIGREVNNGLIVDLELLGGQRLPEFTLERVAILHLRVHLSLEKPKRAAPIALGSVKSQIRIAHQLRRGVSVVGADRDANTDPNDHELRVDLIRCSHRVYNAKRKRGRVRRFLNPHLHDRELIAAHARHSISLPDQRTQSIGNHLEELVSDGMS